MRMPQIEGTSRHQMQIFALEQAISMDNPVRVIDAFVSTLSLEELKNCSEEGITTYVAPKEANHNKKEEAYQKRQFTYDTETDTYTCPKRGSTGDKRAVVHQEQGKREAAVPDQALSAAV